MTTSEPKDEEPSEDKNPTSGESWLEKATKRFIQPNKVKVGVYDIVLGILPVVLTFHGTLAADYGESSTLNISTWIYAVLIVIVLGYCSLARWYAGDDENHAAMFIALVGLVVA
uniref:hypothetical protein n=1 Tax=Corynebacterium stationis TaxID=1705 RepID=UPI00262E95C5